MNTKLTILGLVGALTFSVSAANALVISFDVGTPSHTANGGSLVSNPGTVGIGEVASYVSGGTGLTGIGTCWPSGIGCDPGGVAVSPATAASAIDHYWLQGAGGTATARISYSFTSATSKVVAVAGIDHGPLPGEAAEFIVWGSSDGTTLSEEGAITAIFDLGVDGSDGPDLGGPGGAGISVGDSDDFSQIWSFVSSWSFFVVTPGDHIAGFSSPGEYEIDGLAKPVPEPITLVLIGLGMVGIGFGRWTQR